MSTPFSYGQLMPSVTKNFGSGPAEELTAHEYKTLWYAAVSDIEKLQTRMDGANELLRQALSALEAALSDDQPYIVQSKDAVVAIKEFLQ